MGNDIEILEGLERFIFEAVNKYHKQPSGVVEFQKKTQVIKDGTHAYIYSRVLFE